MPAAVLFWVVVLIGPDFVIEARWGQSQFADRDQCESWLADAISQRAANLRGDVKADCRPGGAREVEFEE
jgi:hypothetical protein